MIKRSWPSGPWRSRRPTTMEDIQAQTKLLREIRADLESAVSMVNQSEWIRKQIADLKAMLTDEKPAENGSRRVQRFIEREESSPYHQLGGPLSGAFLNNKDRAGRRTES